MKELRKETLMRHVRTCSMLLTATLLFSSVPMAVVAEEQVVNGEVVIIETVEESYASSEIVPSIDYPEVIEVIDESTDTFVENNEELDATEPALSTYNSFDNAMSIEVNKFYTDSTQTNETHNYYTFILNDAGYITLQMAHGYIDSSNNRWNIKLYSDIDKSGSMYEMDVAGDQENTESWSIGLPAGTYYVVISPVNKYSSHYSAINYDFRVNFTKSDLWEKERNDSFETSDRIEVGTTYYGASNMSYDYDDDFFYFELPEASLIVISFGHKYIDSSNNKWDIYLYKDTDKSNSIASYKSSGHETEWTTSALSLSAGKYYLRVRPTTKYSGNRSGVTYHFKINHEVKPQAIRLNKTSASMNPGTVMQLFPTFTPSDTTNQRVSWSSSDSSVASVTSDGVVTAKGNGTATITVKTNALGGNGSTLVATCKITVGASGNSSSNKKPAGWQTATNGKYWYRNSNGSYPKNKWQQISGKWYHFDKSGYMQTGWKKIGGKWYYLGGKNDGAMKTGWKKIGGKWYYLGGKNDGAMKTGWKKINGKWYYMNGKGVMQTGWKQISGKWYYFESSGKMLANASRKIGNKIYRFNSSGVCTNP